MAFEDIDAGAALQQKRGQVFGARQNLQNQINQLRNRAASMRAEAPIIQEQQKRAERALKLQEQAQKLREQGEARKAKELDAVRRDLEKQTGTPPGSFEPPGGGGAAAPAGQPPAAPPAPAQPAPGGAPQQGLPQQPPAAQPQAPQVPPTPQRADFDSANRVYEKALEEYNANYGEGEPESIQGKLKKKAAAANLKRDYAQLEVLWGRADLADRAAKQKMDQAMGAAQETQSGLTAMSNAAATGDVAGVEGAYRDIATRMDPATLKAVRPDYENFLQQAKLAKAAQNVTNEAQGKAFADAWTPIYGKLIQGYQKDLVDPLVRNNPDALFESGSHHRMAMLDAYLNHIAAIELTGKSAQLQAMMKGHAGAKYHAMVADFDKNKQPVVPKHRDLTPKGKASFDAAVKAAKGAQTRNQRAAIYSAALQDYAMGKIGAPDVMMIKSMMGMAPIQVNVITNPMSDKMKKQLGLE